MGKSMVTTKGQVVIPAEIRKKLHITKGTVMQIQEDGDKIIMRPITAEYIKSLAGMFKTKGKMTRLLLEERAKDKQRGA